MEDKAGIEFGIDTMMYTGYEYMNKCNLNAHFMPMFYRHKNCHLLPIKSQSHPRYKPMAKPKTSSNHIDLSSLVYPEKKLKFLLPFPHEREIDPAKIEVALLERIKELNCMYAMAILAERYSDSIEDFLRNLVNILPPSWQYPEITCARILFDRKIYKSRVFKASKWRQSSRILMYNEPMGEVEVFYFEERPPEDEGPFLREERLLLDAIAEQIGKTAVRISAEQELIELNKQLTVESKALQEANVALREVLQRIEEEKMDIKKSVQANVEKILMPILYALSLE
ncbi:MAG: hypothetical protein JSW12_12950, partial [Deltaproteobacteria bacterium]